ncbi:uncharacterized protein LOC114327833 isoform X1 [Diabrotica virgifera virgifera]|uniref:Uncharacterized protein LOC114327833 isoform X1 n=1 Tax=Diabrotica virgifera virgifera TaxID=50390 RepID=A0A6P7FGI2_DIAVI|nr:uncharacterized protein LOC114327833 isoform X1 [Diabrotica virgifera virgifera]
MMISFPNAVPRLLAHKPTKPRWWQKPCGDQHGEYESPFNPDDFQHWHLIELHHSVSYKLKQFLNLDKRLSAIHHDLINQKLDFMRPITKWKEAYDRLMNPEKCLRDLNDDLTRCLGALQITYSYQEGREDTLEYDGLFKWAVRDLKIFMCRLKLLFKITLKKELIYPNPYAEAPKEDLANLDGKSRRTKRVQRDYAFYHHYLKTMETAVELLKFYVTCKASNFDPAPTVKPSVAREIMR